MAFELPEDIQGIVDELRELSESVPVPLELPSEDDLIVVEEEILLPLPKDYKWFLLTVSDVVYGSIEPLTASDPGSYNHLPDVTAQAWHDGLPRHVFPVCRDGDGYYCMDANGEIYQWQGDELGEMVFESIWDWAREVWLEY